MMETLENSNTPITLYLYGLSLSDFFVQLQQASYLDKIDTLIKNIDEIFICSNPFNNKTICIYPENFLRFMHQIELNIQHQFKSGKITLATEFGKYGNIKRITFDNPEYLI